MRSIPSPSALARPAALVALAVTLGGCAHVKPEELDAGLSNLRTELRQEMAGGDQAVGARVTTLEGRVNDLATRVSNLERELTRLAGELNGTVERLESALRFNVPLYFGFDEAVIIDRHREILDRFASVIQQHYPEAIITAEGFADPSGSQSYNQALGLRRAEAVRTYLAQQGGLMPDRIRAVSYGEARARLIVPEGKGPGEAGWENRRVALVVDHGAGAR